MSRLVIISAVDAEQLRQVHAIRDRVFVREQGVPPELEHDEIDGVAHHVLASIDGAGVGTGRAFARKEHPGEAGIGRVAVVAEARRQGVGRAIVLALLDWCRATGFCVVRIHAQCYIAGLYAQLGFRPVGEVFLEAGLEHVEMMLVLPAATPLTT